MAGSRQAHDIQSPNTHDYSGLGSHKPNRDERLPGAGETVVITNTAWLIADPAVFCGRRSLTLLEPSAPRELFPLPILDEGVYSSLPDGPHAGRVPPFVET
jgi:hypothetical protein